MEKRVINYVGWLGYSNLGDEALYLSAQMIFSPYRLMPYHGRSCYSRISIMGGGTLLPTWTLSILPNKYNYAYGVGVRSPAFWGDLHPFVVELIKRFNFRLLGVRGNMSRKLLRGWGIESEVIGDPCLLLEPHSYKKRRMKTVAVNAGTSFGKIWGGDEERVLREMIKLCRLLKKESFYPVLIPFWSDDISYIKKISEVAKVDIFENWADIKCVLDFIASCAVLIGEKLHSAVFSASAYTPFISLEYRPKCQEFAESMGFGEYTIRTDEITAERLMMLFYKLLNNWREMHSLLIRNVKMYRRKLRDFAARIRDDIESLQDGWFAPSLLESRKRAVLYGSDVYLFNHYNNIWRAWYEIPIRKRVHCWLDSLRTLI